MLNISLIIGWIITGTVVYLLCLKSLQDMFDPEDAKKNLFEDRIVSLIYGMFGPIGLLLLLMVYCWTKK